MFHPQNQVALESERLFEINGFTAHLCRTPQSREMAYSLRYQAYRHADAIPENDEKLFYDKYDLDQNSRVHLVWYQGNPVATVRSSIWSPRYGWMVTEGLDTFWQDTHRKIGLENRILESSRFAVSPEIKGRKSLFVQLLLFRIQDLCAQVEECPYIITAVRLRHVPFYERMLAFRKISGPYEYEWLDDQIVLLATGQEESRQVVLDKGMPACKEEEIERYQQLVKSTKATGDEQ